MTQLPPKIPNVTPSNWPDLFSSHHNQKMPSMASLSQPNNGTATITTTHHSPSWMDEFLHFSSARRGAHGRSMSDSITFIEAETGIPARSGAENSEFDRFDEEQFMRMFNDEMSESSMHPLPNLSSSSPSDHNSINDEKEMSIRQNQKEEEQLLKNESDEVESQCKYQEPHAPNNTSPTCSSDKITDPKRVKRILANRKSAQRSRVKKLQYISELERSVTSLQAEVSVLSPRVAFLDHQRLLLNVDNSALKQRIAALAQDNIFKDARHEALKGEIERLREVYQQQQQNLKKMKSGGGSPSSSPTPRCDAPHNEKEQLVKV